MQLITYRFKWVCFYYDSFVSLSDLLLINMVIVCALGHLSPPTIQCGTGARRSREEYLTEIEYINPNSNNSGLVSSSAQRLINAHDYKTNTIVGGHANHLYGSGRDCNVPKKVEDTMVYK